MLIALLCTREFGTQAIGKSGSDPAQVCALINACFLPFTEGLAPFREFMRIGVPIMFSNAFAAFALNVAAVFLISAAGGLVLTLAGVFKVNRPSRTMPDSADDRVRTFSSSRRAAYSSALPSQRRRFSVSPSAWYSARSALTTGRL